MVNLARPDCGWVPADGPEALFVKIGDNDTFDKTWQEVVDAIVAGANVIVYSGDLESLALFYCIEGFNASGHSIALSTVGLGGTVTFEVYSAASADGYPVIDD